VAEVGTVSDKGGPPAPERAALAHVIGPGEKPPGPNQNARAMVDSQFGSSTVTKNHIEIAAIKVEPYWNNGCNFVHGDQADTAYDRQKYDGTLALNQSTNPRAERAKPGKEQEIANQLTQHRLAPDDQYGYFPDDKSTKMRELLKDLNKDQTQRVLNSANDKLAQQGYKFAQTSDGGVWVGSKKPNGEYEANDIMRYPDCTVG
jgi:hypothetical protein